MNRVIAVEVPEDFVLLLTFTNGVKKRVDLTEELHGPMFQPMRDPVEFRKVFVEHGTIRWPNGADICPDVLYYGRDSVPWAQKYFAKKSIR